MSTRAMVERSKEMKSLGYTGLHAFLFVDHADAASGSLREVLANAWHHSHFENGQVLFAHEFVGPFLGFAHLRAAKDDLEGLEGCSRSFGITAWDAASRSRPAAT